VDFLLVLIEPLLLVVATELLRADNQRFCSNGVTLAQHFRSNGSPPPTVLLIRKLPWMIFHTVEETGRKLLSFRQNPPIRPTNRQTDEKALAV